MAAPPEVSVPDEPQLITDVAPPFHDEQAHRRRVYGWLMIVHVVGFALSYPCYLWHPWAGVVAIGATGPLPWVAVLFANGGPPRPARRVVPTVHGSTVITPSAIEPPRR